MKKLLAIFILAGLIPACTFAEITAPAGGDTSGLATSSDLATVQAQLDESSVHGSVYIKDGTNVVTVATPETYYPIVTWSTNIAQSAAAPSGMTATATGLVVQVAGKYNAFHSISLFGSAASTIETAIFVTSVRQDRGEVNRKIPINDVGDVGSALQIDLLVGDVVNIYVTALDAIDITPVQASLVLTKIGGYKGDKGEVGSMAAASSMTLLSTSNSTVYAYTFTVNPTGDVFTVVKTVE